MSEQDLTTRLLQGLYRMIRIERLGPPVSQTRVTKNVVYTERLTDQGELEKTTVVQTGMLDCGHISEPAGFCSHCGLVCCRECLEPCSGCNRLTAKQCLRESVFDGNVKYCPNCRGLGPILRRILLP